MTVLAVATLIILAVSFIMIMITKINFENPSHKYWYDWFGSKLFFIGLVLTGVNLALYAIGVQYE